VATGRRSLSVAGRPLWSRLYLDLVLLGLAGLVFWVTRRNGYQLVLVPEGVPTISVDYRAFAGPVLLWIGSGLLVWRLAELALRRGQAGVRRLVRPMAGNLAGTVAASMSRQRRLLSRAAVLVMLAVSFAGSTAVFNTTYRRQADLDARLTNGADVTVTEPPGANVGPGAASQLASVPGARLVEPLQHRFAYVGADLQDLYGVRPGTVASAADLRDTYFAGGSARQLLGRLAASPDSILVSEETVRDYQLKAGDQVTLRLQDGRTGLLAPVTFHYAGIVREFPTAPRDSFLVANADYVATMTGNDAVGAFLIATGGATPSAVADRVRTVVGPGASVTDIGTSRRVVGSTLTAVDLAGLTRVELGFALVLAAASSGLVLAMGLAERRRTFAIAGALGARPRQLYAFVWAESGFVLVGGLLLGGLGGMALARMLVGVLQGVFDPPPSTLAVPWPYLGTTAAVAVVAVAVASRAAIRTAAGATAATLREL
jgi:putative ABC transport system permease protein